MIELRLILLPNQCRNKVLMASVNKKIEYIKSSTLNKADTFRLKVGVMARSRTKLLKPLGHHSVGIFS